MERSFRHVAEAKHLSFDIEMDPELPRSMTTDIKRLQQVLKNLLSNAFKFTSHGGVTFRIGIASTGWGYDHALLKRALRVIAFEVSDTGIGIAPDKQKLSLRRFHQADAGYKPALWRHRSRSGDQPRIGDPSGRRNPSLQHA